MKVLYAIQGTGNGHASRARDLVPFLKSKVQCDVLISGTQYDVNNFDFEIDYHVKGLSFVFGKNGGIDLLKTLFAINLFRLTRELVSLPVEQYDLVINDFEPVSAWAARLRKVPCVSVSHQSAVLSPKAPRPMFNDWKGEFILRNYAPVQKAYGFHFRQYGKNISTPVIRQEIRRMVPTNEGHFTVYLPAFSDQAIIEVLSKVEGTRWQVFSKHTKSSTEVGSIAIQPIDNFAFLKSLETCRGILCGAGFETPAEALYLGKRLMVIPMKGQYEQHLNAAALKELGVPVINQLHSKVKDIQRWVDRGKAIKVNYPDNAERIIDQVLNNFISKEQSRSYVPKTITDLSQTAL